MPLLPPLEALLCRTEARENAKALLMALIRRVLRTAVLASLLVVKAGAEKPPQLLPTRDVDIIYEVTLPSQSRIRERLRYLAAELLERVDSPYKSTTIFDRRTHEITILCVGKPYLSQVGYAAAAARARARGDAQARQRISRCGIPLRRLVVDGRCGDAHCVHHRGRRAASFSRRRPDSFGGAFGGLSSATG